MKEYYRVSWYVKDRIPKQINSGKFTEDKANIDAWVKAMNKEYPYLYHWTEMRYLTEKEFENGEEGRVYN